MSPSGMYSVMEDYLEILTEFNQLPAKVFASLSEIGEVDMRLQKELKKLNERAGTFYKKGKKMSAVQRAAEYSDIRKDYYDLTKDADWKIFQVDELYDTVMRYLQYLEREAQKLKNDLEAVKPGITGVLEKKVTPIIISGRGNRKRSWRK